MMELYIFDASLNFVGLLDNFISLQWTRRYAKYGEFELHCSLNPENLALLVRGNIVWKKDDPEAGYNYIDLGSTFLQLDVGDNLMRYDADTGIDNLEVSIYFTPQYLGCLLYTSDAADEEDSVDLGGRRIIKKKKK